MSAVALQALNKAFGTTKALEGVSLEIRKGEFFALLGPSGCGKTTLLRSIAGFVTPDSGQILLDGQPVERLPVARREIGLMFQNYALFPHLSVRENLGFGLSVRRRPKAEIAARVDEMLALVRLEGFGDRKPRELSGGQQQRVALARALAPRPQVLLLDEPLGALDRALRAEMQFELKQIQRDLGITTIFVTHDQEEALTLSDRIAILREGRIEQTGQPREVYERPESRFSANFLGGANFFSGLVEGQEEGGSLIRLTGGGLVLSGDRAVTGSKVTLALRPEKLRILQGEEPRNILEGIVSHEVFNGTSLVLHLESSAGKLTVFDRNAGSLPPRQGARLRLGFDPAHAVILQRD